jgi:hypothetical protein
MKNTKQKLALSQETLRILTQEQRRSLENNQGTTVPVFCPTTWNFPPQAKAGTQ